MAFTTPTVTQRVDDDKETMTDFQKELKEMIDKAFDKAMEAVHRSLKEFSKERQIIATKKLEAEFEGLESEMGGKLTEMQSFTVPIKDKIDGSIDNPGPGSTGILTPLVGLDERVKPTSGCHMSSSIDAQHYRFGDTLVQQPESYVLQLFDEKSEREIVQKAPLSITKGTNPLTCSPNPYWNDLKTHCSRVMVYKLHENEYGKIDSNFYDKFKNMIKSRKPTDTKVECSHNTIELRTVDGLMKDKSQGAPNGYYIIPVEVDARLLQGDPLKIDQSPFTGGSLPVTKNPGDGVYSCSTCKQGEIEVVVIATGVHIFFGRTTHLVENTTHVGHFQQVLSAIGNFCICLIAMGMLIKIIVVASQQRKYRQVVDNLLVLLIGGIPIAIEGFSITVHVYLYPLSNTGHDLKSASVTVVTEDFVLLNNFSFKDYNGSYLMREFSINVTSDTLSMAFRPSNNSIEFVNAIEVVSLPKELLPEQAHALSPIALVSGFSKLAFVTIYRLNMGGPLITAQNDTLGRTWINDEKYLHVNSSAVNVSVSPAIIEYPAAVTLEIAPNMVYATAETRGDPNVTDSNFNMTWVLPFDPEFSYLVRVHFCDIYNTSAEWAAAILNGLEVMKISNEAKSLDGHDADANLLLSSSKKKKVGMIVGCAAGASAELLLIGLCYCCLVVRKSKTPNQGNSWLLLPLYGNSLTLTKGSTVSQKSAKASCISLASSNLGRFFTFQEIMEATNKFDESSLLGVGGFGRVYQGTLEDGTKVAVKRGNPRSEQGLAEFRTEIEILSKLRHHHLVSLIRYCNERSEMVLLYEYMANGPLRSHLYGSDLPPFSWKQRLEICMEAAESSAYLKGEFTQIALKWANLESANEELKRRVSHAEDQATQSFSEIDKLVETNTQLKSKINKLQELLNYEYAEKEESQETSQKLSSHRSTIMGRHDRHSRAAELADSHKIELEQTLTRLKEVENMAKELKNRSSQFEKDCEGLAGVNFNLTQELFDHISMILAAFLDERGVTFDLEDKVVLWERGIVMD